MSCHQSQTSSEFILIENDVFHSRVINPFTNSTQLFFLSVIFSSHELQSCLSFANFAMKKESCVLSCYCRYGIR